MPWQSEKLPCKQSRGGVTFRVILQGMVIIMKLFEKTVYPLGIWEGPRAFVMTSEGEADRRYREIRDAGMDTVFLFAELADPAWLARTLTAAERNGIFLIADLSAVWRDGDKRDAVLAATKDCPAVVAYNIVDEPPRAWFPELRVAVESVRAAVPGKDIFINLNPNYAPDSFLGAADGVPDSTPYRAYLRAFVETVPVDCLSFDFYPYVGSSEGEAVYRVEFLRNLTDMKVAADAAGLPFAGFLQSSRWGRYDTAVDGEGTARTVWRGTRLPTAAEYRYLAGTHLAFGAQMLTNFLYWSRSGTRPDQRMPGVFDGIMAETGEANPIRAAVCRVSAEVRALTAPIRGWRHVGVMSCGLSASEAAAIQPVAKERFGAFRALAGEGRFLAGCFEKDGQTALMVVNMCEDGQEGARAVEIVPDAVQTATVQTVQTDESVQTVQTVYKSDGTTTVHRGGTVRLMLESGEAAVIVCGGGE